MPRAKRRGRPKSDSKNRQIFDAAVALFIRQGYEATRIEEVAARAGVSKQTIYSHFDGKDHLFAAAMTHVCERLGMPAGFEQDPRAPAVVLAEIGGQFLRLLLTEESMRLYRLLLSNVERHPDVAQLFYTTGPRTFITRLAAYLKAQSDAGVLRVAHPERAAAQFFSLMRGELHMRAVLGVEPRPTEAEIDRYIREATRVFVRGHAPHSAQAVR